MKPTSRAQRRSVLLAAASVGVVAAAVLSGCGATKAAANSGASSAATAPSGSGRGAFPGGGGGGSFPGATGQVAQISGSSMEVQNPDSGQVTVSWTASTKFTRTTTVTAKSIAAGDCVTVSGSSASGMITAGTVAISTATSGSCTTRAFAGAPRRTSFPSGGSFVRRRSSSKPPKAFKKEKNVAVASGKVVSVTSTSMVVDGFAFSGATGARTATGNKATDSTVRLSTSTKYTETLAAGAADLADGDCVTATGTTNSIGAVAATRIAITSTGAKSCTEEPGAGGFGAGGFGAGELGGGGSGGASGA